MAHALLLVVDNTLAERALRPGLELLGVEDLAVISDWLAGETHFDDAFEVAAWSRALAANVNGDAL